MARDATTYKDAVKSFNVKTNPIYQPGPGGKPTYCNVFAFDVMKHSDIKAPLPTLGDYEGSNSTTPATCGKMLSVLSGGTWSKWVGVMASKAQEKANLGYPTIAICDEHMAVVIPGTPTTQLADIRIAQAGSSCKFDEPLSYGFTGAQAPNIKFYYWFAD